MWRFVGEYQNLHKTNANASTHVQVILTPSPHEVLIFRQKIGKQCHVQQLVGVIRLLTFLHGVLARACLLPQHPTVRLRFFLRPCFIDYFDMMLEPFSSQVTVSELKGRMEQAQS
mmetsp:Transcript_12859/g.39680  ORF Transcript_12859/g.39680 Transcript_12859/m.39680 type:complete len:115 (+) Transcript_12859:1279-1623(+)